MSKKPWYIWFSILAFIVLWADIGTRFLFFKNLINNTKAFNLWMNVLGKTLKWWVGFIISTVVVSASFNYLIQVFPKLTLVFQGIQILSLYLIGVYISYKCYVWRKENLPKLNLCKDCN